jgi:peptidoglycan/xylan/chitin deacetylase (PgdA/CDA1 family)
MSQKLKIQLTFDDGPNEYTLKILKTLKEFNIKATFLL